MAQQAQQTQAQQTQAQQIQVQAQQIQAPQQSGGTPFVWAKLVAGKKMNLVEVQSAEKKAAEEKERMRLEKIQKNDELRRENELKRQDKEAEVEKVNAAYIAQRTQQKEADALKYTKENGYWGDMWRHYDERTAQTLYHSEWREIPRSINQHALKFAQSFLDHFPEISQYTTLGQLEQKFKDTIVPWALLQYQRSNTTDYIQYEEKFTTPTTRRGDLLERWMVQEKIDYETKKNGPHSMPPWQEYPLWIFASNVTWLNFIKALDVKSGAFASGILAIDGGGYSNPHAKITWLVCLDPYTKTQFKEKPMCAAKRKRMEDEDDY